MASPLLETLMQDIKSTMKAKDSETLTTLRTLHSEIKNVGIDQKRDITDEDVATVVAKGIKQRQDAAEQFTQAGREDLVVKEQKQIEVYKKYQPEQLDRAAIIELVKKIISDTGASSKKEMGKVMKELMPLVKGKADGKLISEIVNSILS